MGQAPPGSSYNADRIGLPLLAGASDFGDIVPNPSKFTSQPTQLAQPGDIILCIRATIGDTNWADRDYCLGRGVAGLRPYSDQLDPKFLWHWLNSHKPELERYATGSTFKQISRQIIESTEIPLPLLPEQRRIAAMLDKADGVRRKRRAAVGLAEELLRAAFLEMFGDPVGNPRGWDRCSVKTFGTITTGNTPSRAVPANYGDGIEWIKSDNINTPFHILTKAAESLSEQGEASGRVVPPGSILVTCIAGSPDCIGNAAIADRAVAFNQQINAITPNDRTNAYFLYTQILVGKTLIQNASTNSMKGMVSKDRFSRIELIAPPKNLQAQFGGIFLAILRQQEKGWEALELADTLFAALVQRAFRGEL